MSETSLKYCELDLKELLEENRKLREALTVIMEQGGDVVEAWSSRTARIALSLLRCKDASPDTQDDGR
jgi:hypothetical protein